MPPLNTIQKSALTLAIGQSIAHGVHAATITVDNGGDAGQGCTFREAIQSIRTRGASDNGCTATGSEFGDQDSILFSVDSINILNAEINIQQNVLINPNGRRVTIKANGADRVLSVGSRSTTVNTVNVSLNNLEISGGLAPAGESGGGLLLQNSSVTISNSTIAGNSAQRSAFGGLGGGVSISYGELTLVNSTISNNIADGAGGGIYSRAATVDLINSTVSGNESSGSAGGIRVGSRATLELCPRTVSNNSADNRGGGLYLLSDSNSFVSLINSIVLGNTGGTADEIYARSSMTVTSVSSVLGSTTGALNNVQPSSSDISIDLNATELTSVLLPLGNNGGTAATHALPTNSPAINAGDPSSCGNLPTRNFDQRGRPRDAMPDIGAFEFVEDRGTFFVVPASNGKTVVFEL